MIIATKPSFDEEKILWNKGFDYVLGIDEVGRGAFAGPIFAACVVFPQNFNESLLIGVNDSKLLRPKERDDMSKIIKKHALSHSIVSVGLGVINKRGIGYANKMAFRKAIAKTILKLDTGKHFVLADGFHVKYVRGIGLKNQKAIIKGDRRSLSIAAASILAKVERDKFMQNLALVYSEYGWEKNKGYGTLKHQNAIRKFGLTDAHRRSFNLSGSGI